ncbi:MAG TPA: hypothetical protein DEO36_08430 [Flavobacteriaceae bacterium]|jgi:two-component system LytT family response regulator|nr:hypothetical protein [Flavobacteriaceae bacterium]
MRQSIRIEQKPVDHLLQLLNPNELQGVLDRVILNISSKIEYRHLLDRLKNTIENKEPRIVLKTSRQHYVLHVKDIIHLEADGAYTSFYTTTQKIVVSKNIKYYQNMLDNSFIRCHQSHLINSKHILGIDKKGLLQLTNDSLIPVSVRNKPKIIKLINNFNTLRKVS